MRPLGGSTFRLRDALGDLEIEVGPSWLDRDAAARSARDLELFLWRLGARDRDATRVLLAVYERLTGIAVPAARAASTAWTAPATSAFADELRLAARAGRVHVRRVGRAALRALVTARAEDEETVLGPDTRPAPVEFLRVLLYDSAGQRIPSDLDPFPAKVEPRIGGGPNFVRAFVRGTVDVDGIAPGFPSACPLVFSGVFDGDDPVPTAAPPAVDAVPDASRPPLGATVLLTRRELAGTHAGTLDATNVFQLRRRDADVLEAEHFFPASAVFHPGPPPPGVALRPGAPVVRGVDVLAACLRDAADLPAGCVLVTGHDAALSKPRADCIEALLTADRDAWLAVVQVHSRPADVQHLLAWAAGAFGWPCDPGGITDAWDAPTARAVRAFQGSYDADFEAGLFPQPHGPAEILVDGIVGPQTWGAMFDAVQRALHPVPQTPPANGSLGYIVVDAQHQTYPVELAQIAAPNHDANRWVDLNDPNPDMVNHGPGGGWLPPQVGQPIYIPTDWSLPALKAAGYATVSPVDAPPSSPPPPPAPSAPPALARDAVLAFGCGAHHLDTPDAPGRRAVQRQAEIVFVDPDAPTPIVQCGPGAGPCKAKRCELYDPREYDLTYLDPAATLPAGGIIDFFVYREDEDALDAGVEIASEWGAPLRLGWAVQGDVQRLAIRNDVVGLSVDVTPASRLCADGRTMGSVPLVVLPHAASEGEARYRLEVERPGGAVAFEPRVRVTIASAPPAKLPFAFVPLYGAPHAHAMGLGRTRPRTPARAA